MNTANIVSNAKDEAKEMGRNLHNSANERVDAATTAIGEKLDTAASRVRKNKIVGRTADRLDAAGEYLEGANYDDLMHDVTDVVKRHPVPVLLAGVGIGYMLARVVGR